MAISSDPAPFTHGSKHMLMLSWSHTHKKFNLRTRSNFPKSSVEKPPDLARLKLSVWRGERRRGEGTEYLMSLASRGMLGHPLYWKKTHVTLQSWYPSGCPFTKIDLRTFVITCFGRGRRADSGWEIKDGIWGINRSLYHMSLDWRKCSILRAIWKIFLIKLTVALDQRIKGLLLNSLKYCKHKSTSGCA